jgi:uncharacterized protein (TIGR02118 family)
MFKFMIIFQHPEPTAIRNFEVNYTQLLAHIEQMPGVKRRQVNHVVGSPVGQSPFYRILEVYFDDRPQMEQALMTPEGQRAGAQLQEFAPGSFEMAFAEVYEEIGGYTPTNEREEDNGSA